VPPTILLLILILYVARLNFWLILKMTVSSKDKQWLPKNSSNAYIVINMYMYTHTHQPSPVVRDMAVNITLSPLSES
jgi:hypothetical protein